MQPLDGIRVLDLTHVIAGPLATHQMRLLGAEVIKVERPGQGDGIRSLAANPQLGGLTPAFRALNIGKKSVEIDLAAPEGRAQALEIAAAAQVVVENFRPGVAARLGLSAEDIRAVRPDVIYCSISGWGRTGPRAETPAYDHVVQAATGMMALQGDGAEGAAPVKVGFPVIDAAAGMNAATAVLAALLRRARGDAGPIELDVSMVDSALMLMNTMVAGARATGAAPRPAGNRGFVASPGADTLPTRDGWIALGANTMRQFRTLCAILGRPELAGPPWLPPGLPDGAFLTGMAGDALRAALIDALAGVCAADLERELLAAGVPASRVRDLHEYLTEIYPETPGMDAPGSDGSALGPGFRWVGETGPQIPPAPRLGAHNADFAPGAEEEA